jgi:polysaccharide pyruvyl transferase WcaK-like protein
VGPEAVRTLYITANRLFHEGKQVLVLLLQPGYDDEILPDLPHHQVEKTSDPRRVLYLAAQAGYVISMRLHGLILAAAAGTPFAALSYDPKVAAFAKETGAYYQELPGDPIKLSKAAMYGRYPDWEKVQALKERARKSFDLALGEAIPVKRPHGRG